MRSAAALLNAVVTVCFPAAAAVIARGWTGLVERAGNAGPALLAELLFKRWRGGNCIAIGADTVKIVMTDWTQAVVTLTDVDLLIGLELLMLTLASYHISTLTPTQLECFITSWSKQLLLQKYQIVGRSGALILTILKLTFFYINVY